MFFLDIALLKCFHSLELYIIFFFFRALDYETDYTKLETRILHIFCYINIMRFQTIFNVNNKREQHL